MTKDAGGQSGVRRVRRAEGEDSEDDPVDNVYRRHQPVTTHHLGIWEPTVRAGPPCLQGLHGAAVSSLVVEEVRAR